MLLNEPVKVAVPEGGKIVWHAGTLVGRTLEPKPHYDVRLESGQIIANASADQVRSTAHQQ